MLSLRKSGGDSAVFYLSRCHTVESNTAGIPQRTQRKDTAVLRYPWSGTLRMTASFLATRRWRGV